MHSMERRQVSHIQREELVVQLHISLMDIYQSYLSGRNFDQDYLSCPISVKGDI